MQVLLKADGMLNLSTLTRAHKEGDLKDMLKDLGMMGGGGRDMGGNMANMPIRAGGPSINMRMPLDPHTGRMFHQGQGRPSPYPNPQMYMAQKRHQAPGPPMGYSNGPGPGMAPSSGGYMGPRWVHSILIIFGHYNRVVQDALPRQ